MLTPNEPDHAWKWMVFAIILALVVGYFLQGGTL